MAFYQRKPDIIIRNGTFSDVNRYCSGMDYVIVNGTPVIVKGEHTGKRPGMVLRHLPKK